LKRTNLLFVAALAIATLRCGTTTPPSSAPPALEARGEDRSLIDPRIGFDRPAPAKVETRF